MPSKVEIEARGETRTRAEVLKEMGFRWDAVRGRWWHRVPRDMLTFYERRLKFVGLAVERRRR